jgi:hypothetical protein
VKNVRVEAEVEAEAEAEEWLSMLTKRRLLSRCGMTDETRWLQSHDGVPSLLIHDIDPEGILSLI